MHVVYFYGFAIQLDNLFYVNLIRGDGVKDNSIGTLFPAIKSYCLSGILKLNGKHHEDELWLPRPWAFTVGAGHSVYVY